MQSKLNILFIHHGHAKGGAAISLLFLAQALIKRDHRVLVLNTTCLPEVDELFKKSGIPTIRYRIRFFPHTTLGALRILSAGDWIYFAYWLLRYPGSWIGLRKVIKDISPDIVHYNSVTLFPYLSAAGTSVTSVVHIREGAYEGMLKIRYNLIRHLLRNQADNIVSICEDNADAFKIGLDKGVVIYNPVDLRKFNSTIDKRESRIKLGISQNAKVCLFAGGCNGVIKGLSDFAEIAKKLYSVDKSVFCLLPSAANEMDKLGIKDTFVAIESICLITEFTYNIENWFAAADIVFVLHKTPHFSRTLLEAGAMKKPFIAYDIGGLREVALKGKGGILVPLGNTDMASEIALELFNNPKKAEVLSRQGHKWVIEHCSATMHAEKIEHTYYKAIKRKVK